MATLDVINVKGEKVESLEVPEHMVTLAGSQSMIHDAIRQHWAAVRRGTVSTLTKSETSYSGRKPWRQKGTGRARSGERSSPIWRGGGIAFGPKPRDYSFRLPRKVKRGALKSALAIRFQKGQVAVLDAIAPEGGKTKRLAEILRGSGIGENALIVTVQRDPALIQASRNLPRVEALSVADLNTLAVVSHEKLVLTKDSFVALKGWMEAVS